jgi:hypothetical protein
MMIIYFLIFIVILLVSKFLKRRRYVDHTCFVEKGVLTKQECNEIINIAKKYKLKIVPENVDGKPEYQIDVFDEGVKNEELWKISNKIYEEKLKPIFRSEKWLSSKKHELDFVFLKKYSPHERSYIPLHLDDNYLTMSFLLSNTENFDGGELYVFDLNQSNEISNIDKNTNFTIELRDKFVKNCKKLPTLNYNQGDLTVYTGGVHAHGTLPVTTGERYILTFFFT